MRLAARLKRFLADRRAATLVEFAFTVPVLTFMMLGSVEIGRYILLNQKLQNAATSLADLAGRGRTLTLPQLQSMFAAVPNITRPFDFDANGVAIVSAITATVANNPVVAWQEDGGGDYVGTSQVGAAGGVADIPDSLPVRVNETIIAAEVYYDFEPLFDLLIEPEVIYRSAFIRPRLGTLTTLEPG
jgi:hypothetical protein